MEDFATPVPNVFLDQIASTVNALPLLLQDHATETWLEFAVMAHFVSITLLLTLACVLHSKAFPLVVIVGALIMGTSVKVL